MHKVVWEQVEELFHRAVEMEPQQRAAFLEQAAAADPRVLREVESLLAYEGKSATFVEDRAILACQLLAECDTPHSDLQSSLERPPPEEVAADPLLGETVSHFRILERLGSGGMGVVYRAEDLTLGRMVALKFLKGRGQDGGGVRQAGTLDSLYREARACCALDHPNICTVYEVGQHESVPFLVMQLLVGRSLRQEIAAGPLASERILEFGRQCAGALEAAHAAGIVHRDIKPANIFLTQRDEIKILDFGVAQSERSLREGRPDAQPVMDDATALGDALGHTAAAFGTVAYMSPQQILGEVLDRRTDIFSLGVVLFEMATGGLPFQGESAPDVLANTLHAEPPAIVPLNPAVPAALRAVITRCLEKDPDRRYQSAAELRDALDRIQPEDARGKRAGGRRLLVTALATLACAAILLVYRDRSSHARPVHRDAIVLADFVNSTGEAVFDETLNQALRVQLEQSPFLNVLSPQVILQEQQYMRLPAEGALSAATALNICRRTASDAMISGAIAALGSHYVISLNVVNCQTGELIANEQREVARREDILPALGKEAHEVRARLGESLLSVQRFDAPVEEATTSSLEALRAYGVGLKKWYAEGEKPSIPFFVKAIELDPRFAMAYARLGNAYFETNQLALGRAAVSKAYDLRSRVSERERLYIESHYHEQVSGDLEKAVQVFQLWQETYPDDPVPYVNLGADYTTLGKHTQALEQDRKALQLEPELGLLYSNLALEYAGLEDYVSADKVLHEAQRRSLTYATLLGTAYELAFLGGDREEMQRQVQSSMNQPWTEAWLLALQADTEAYYGRRAHAGQLTRRAAASARRYDDHEAAVGYELMGALRDAEFGYTREAKAAARKALAEDDGQQTQILGALAMARAGGGVAALAIVRDLQRRLPDDTMVNNYWLPTIRAAAELSRDAPSAALQILQPVTPYDLASPKTPTTAALYPMYLRGLAYLSAAEPAQAAEEFRRILSHRGLAQNYLLLPLAQLQLARASAAMARRTALPPGSGASELQGQQRALQQYRQLLNVWNEADRTLPVLRKAQQELGEIEAEFSTKTPAE
jgi:eukaryotic-like serine/threonine-protein kinase